MYYFTNESLEAIITGLEPNSEDTILTVCGSGDQSFALLEFDCQVVAIDENPQQINYAKKNMNLLERNHFSKFINLNVPEVYLNDDGYLIRKKYFQDSANLNKISANLNKLIFFEGNIFKIFPKKKYSKIYLSNVFRHNFVEIKEQKETLEKLSSKLKNNGLIYFSQGIFLPQKTRNIFPGNLNIDQELTIKARKLEKYWNPVVYKKIVN